jgi:hypothetical protein
VIALINGDLAVSTDTVEHACLEALLKANAANFELITLFHGEQLPAAEATRIVDVIRTTYPNQEIEVQEGSQPHYQFIISVE